LIKNIGYTFCEKFKPNNETLAKLIYELEVTDEETTKKIRPIKNIMKLKNDNTRYFNAIKNLLNSHYGKINDIDTKEIIEYLKAF
jgi:acetolactate synthase small subunit